MWHWEDHNDFTAVRKIDHLRRGVCPESVQGILERVRGVDKRAAAKTAEVLELEELREILSRRGTSRRWRGCRAWARSGPAPSSSSTRTRGASRRFLYAANRNDRFRGKPVVTELDLGRRSGGAGVGPRRQGAALWATPIPLGLEEPPGHTTVRNANLMHPLPMTPSLMGRGVFYPEQIELFAETWGAVLVEGERLAASTPCASSAASSSTPPRCPASA